MIGQHLFHDDCYHNNISLSANQFVFTVVMIFEGVSRIAMDRAKIISEIQRTAAMNGGAALGWRRFEAETGIRYYDWFGKHWRRWGDAVNEAGFEPNRMSEAYDENYLVEQLVLLTRRLARVPTQGDLLLATKADSGLPSAKVFRRLGSKSQRALSVLAYCAANPGYDDEAALWNDVKASDSEISFEATEDLIKVAVGYVYLIKHGPRREYKIGRTNNPLRREGELGIQLPEKCEPIHYIKTDDPAGVESYWHRRFGSKRKQGEWFVLTAQDVSAFKRWQRIY